LKFSRVNLTTTFDYGCDELVFWLKFYGRFSLMIFG